MTHRTVSRSPAGKAKDFRRETKSTNSRGKRTEHRILRVPRAQLTSVLALVVLTALPIARLPKLWVTRRLADMPRAGDGPGHYGIARRFDQTIFPDTFGWTHAYFGGMPDPNFYP